MPKLFYYTYIFGLDSNKFIAGLSHLHSIFCQCFRFVTSNSQYENLLISNLAQSVQTGVSWGEFLPKDAYV